jgi:hypothetical protein
VAKRRGGELHRKAARPAEVQAAEQLKEPRYQENPQCLTLVLAQ